MTPANSGAAGLAEVIVFHPVDTISKRLMRNQSHISSASQLNAVVFQHHASGSLHRRFFTLFPGLGYAASYKILQRVHKYGGQPLIRDYLKEHHGPSFDQMFGDHNSKTMIHATAGSLVGVTEIIFLPLDVLKIKRQTNPQALNGRGIFSILREEGGGLYRGWSWTAARNALGSFALFGGCAAAKQYLFGLEDYNSATCTQNLVASGVGSCASIIVASPLDVVKTRLQSQGFGSKESGFRIVGRMARHEGPGSFFKALLPKILTTGPKITFSFWLAQTLTLAFTGER